MLLPSRIQIRTASAGTPAQAQLSGGPIRSAITARSNSSTISGAIEKPLGKKADLKMLPVQPGDAPDMYAGVRDLIEQLNYDQATRVDHGVTNFVAWCRDYF
jgi:hypothetical protein